MNAGYTPTTDNVRDEYVQRFAQWGNAPARWFDRWLNQVKAEVWLEGNMAGRYEITDPADVPNPYEDNR